MCAFLRMVMLNTLQGPSRYEWRRQDGLQRVLHRVQADQSQTEGNGAAQISAATGEQHSITLYLPSILKEVLNNVRIVASSLREIYCPLHGAKIT
jgi:hypothetical protein